MSTFSSEKFLDFTKAYRYKVVDSTRFGAICGKEDIDCFRWLARRYLESKERFYSACMHDTKIDKLAQGEEICRCAEALFNKTLYLNCVAAGLTGRFIVRRIREDEDRVMLADKIVRKLALAE